MRKVSKGEMKPRNGSDCEDTAPDADCAKAETPASSDAANTAPNSLSTSTSPSPNCPPAGEKNLKLGRPLGAVTSSCTGSRRLRHQLRPWQTKSRAGSEPRPVRSAGYRFFGRNN